MRLSHLNIYYTIEKNLNSNVTIYSYNNTTIFRYVIKYDSEVECFEYQKFGLLDSSIYEINTFNVSLSDEAALEQFFESLFEDQHLFDEFNKMFDYIIKIIRENKCDISDKQIQDIIDLYPEKFI